MIEQQVTKNSANKIIPRCQKSRKSARLTSNSITRSSSSYKFQPKFPGGFSTTPTPPAEPSILFTSFLRAY
jgi:hypothetical protein